MTNQSVVGLFLGILLAAGIGWADAQPGGNEARFGELDRMNWTKKFEDSGRGDWTQGWFLDGERATVRNTEQGMQLSAGPIEYDYASHCVLWTRESFKGDVRIDYDFKRLDTINKHVNILYIQATGIEVGAYTKDIAEWSHLREIPWMSTYYKNMKLLHISYAAYPMKGSDEDYVRARRYPIRPDLAFDEIDLPPDTFNTGLFKPGQLNHITVIKREQELHMRVRTDEKTMYFGWDTSAFPAIAEGRIGLRQMFTRSSRYSNFTVSTLDN
jgi:hypothetical protein